MQETLAHYQIKEKITLLDMRGSIPVSETQDFEAVRQDQAKKVAYNGD